MTKTRGTTALWLLVALIAANQKECLCDQPTADQTTTRQQLQQQLQQPPNMVQGAVNTLANGMPSALPQQMQQQQQQQQPSRIQTGVTPQAGGQFPTQNGDGQQPLNVQPSMMVNGQQQPMPTVNNPQQQQPTAYYNQQQQQPVQPQMQQQQHQQGVNLPARQNFNPQQQQPELHGPQQQWRPQAMPQMQQPQHMMQQHVPQTQMQPLPMQGQQLPVQGQQYVQSMQQMPQRPLPMTQPQQQLSTVQQYGGTQPMQNYQNPGQQQYQTPNQGYANMQTTATGQPMALNGQQLQRQPSQGSSLNAVFTLLDPTPISRQALDTTTSTIGSAMNMGTAVKNSIGGAAVEIANKVVDGSEALIQGMFNLASAVPATVAGMKHKGIDSMASFLNLPNSRQQQQQLKLQQQQQLQQQLLQQQQAGYYQPSNNAQPQYQGYQGTAQSSQNPVNVAQPIVRYNSMTAGN